MPTPHVSIKGEYGTVEMRPVLRLFDPEARRLFGDPVVRRKDPPTFEELGIPNWLVLYETKLPITESSKPNAALNATPKDRALMYLDGKFSGTLSRTHNIRSLPLRISGAEELKLLVETQGRVNFGNIDVEDFKVFKNSNLFLSLKITCFRDK